MLLLFLTVVFSTNIAALSVSYGNEETELLVCHLLRKTPNYQKLMLQRKSNCLSNVKTFGEVVCLLDKYNNVSKYI
jgi:hypothetical protein